MKTLALIIALFMAMPLIKAQELNVSFKLMDSCFDNKKISNIKVVVNNHSDKDLCFCWHNLDFYLTQDDIIAPKRPIDSLCLVDRYTYEYVDTSKIRRNGWCKVKSHSCDTISLQTSQLEEYDLLPNQSYELRCKYVNTGKKKDKNISILSIPLVITTCQ